MSEPILCGFCNELITHLWLAESCCGEMYHHVCYIAHRDQQAAATVYNGNTR